MSKKIDFGLKKIRSESRGGEPALILVFHRICQA